jgi:hypothetical protein
MGSKYGPGSKSGYEELGARKNTYFKAFWILKTGTYTSHLFTLEWRTVEPL